MKITSQFNFLLTFCAVALLFSSCSDDDDNSVDPIDNSSEKLFAVAFSAETPDGFIRYLTTAPEITDTTTLDPGVGIELGARFDVIGPEQGGYVLAISRNENEITRYDLSDEGTLVEGATLSFANTGAILLDRNFIIVDDETAFYFGIISPQAIRFNPTSMEITGTVSYPEAIREGFDFTQRRPLQRGNQIFCVVGHGIPDVSFGVAPGVDMVILDIQTNTVQIASDSRGLGDIEFTTLGPDNAVYVWSDFATPWISAVRDSSVPANFVLRIPDGSNEFDPDYFVTISDNGEDVPLYAYQQFPNGDVLADVRITDLAPYTLEGGPRGVNGWRQAIVPWPNFDQVNIVEEIPIGGEGFLNLKSDGKIYSINFNNDDFSSMYYQWTSSSDFQQVFRTDGSTVILPHVIVRLR